MGSQPSPGVGPGKPNLPLGLRGKAGGCARVTAGPKRPHLGVCPGPNIPLQGRQGSRGCIPGSPGESGLVLSEEGNPAGLSSCSGGLRPLVELCVEPAGFADDARGWQCPFVLCLHPQGCLRRGVRATGPFQERTGEWGSFGM